MEPDFRSFVNFGFSQLSAYTVPSFGDIKLLHIRKVLGSNTGPETSSLDYGFKLTMCPSASSGKHRKSVLH